MWIKNNKLVDGKEAVNENMIKLNTLNLVYCTTGEKKYVNNYMRWKNYKRVL